MISTKRILFVSGFDEKVNEEVLYSIFIAFGEILFVKLPSGLEKKGYGFIEFEQAGDAKHALDNVHNSEIYGKTLKVTYAKKEDMDQDSFLEVQESDTQKPSEFHEKKTEDKISTEKDISMNMDDEEDGEDSKLVEPSKKKRKI